MFPEKGVWFKPHSHHPPPSTLQHGAALMRADTKQYHVGYCSRHQEKKRLTLVLLLDADVAKPLERPQPRKIWHCICKNLTLQASVHVVIEQYLQCWTYRERERERSVNPLSEQSCMQCGRPPDSFNNIVYFFSAFFFKIIFRLFVFWQSPIFRHEWERSIVCVKWIIAPEAGAAK